MQPFSADGVPPERADAPERESAMTVRIGDLDGSLTDHQQGGDQVIVASALDEDTFFGDVTGDIADHARGGDDTIIAFRGQVLLASDLMVGDAGGSFLGLARGGD